MASVKGAFGRAPAGIRPVDVVLTAAVAGAVELFVTAASGPGQQPLTAHTYLLGAVLALPVLFRRRWQLRVLLACAALLIGYYAVGRRNVPPTPLLSLPVYDAAVAGYLPWAVAVPACFVTAGLLLVATSHQQMLALAAEFLPRLAGVPVVLWLMPAMIFVLAAVVGRRGGHGLAGMAERATAIGGELTAGPRPGGGFAVRARLPI